MNTTRRFAAILAADVVGYSRLMGDHSVRLTSIRDVALTASNAQEAVIPQFDFCRVRLTLCEEVGSLRVALSQTGQVEARGLCSQAAFYACRRTRGSSLQRPRLGTV
jgi:hypothetical protein